MDHSLECDACIMNPNIVPLKLCTGSQVIPFIDHFNYKSSKLFYHALWKTQEICKAYVGDMEDNWRHGNKAIGTYHL